MRRLELDYFREAKRTRAAVFALGTFAVFFAADAGLYFANLSDDLAFKESRIAKIVQAPERRSPPATTLSPEEAAFARDTLRLLATPWESLFQALEAAKTDRVALLAIEPNVESRTVTITGEARDYLGALTYVARLADEPRLTRVHLVRHELRRNTPQRQIAFTVSASWRDER